ncbi:DUF6894 family protein [Rhodopseudomonas sp. RCAM05734]|uniref:DUF6894 family protein n=1 Tax=Rhodopseudomonas sp. RCAM05734 TaxID=3457549 RepID=UPI00404410A2
MVDFYFEIVSDGSDPVSRRPGQFADAAAARAEAAAVFADFSRDIAAQLVASSEWRLDVLDKSRKLIYRIKVVAEAP